MHIQCSDLAMNSLVATRKSDSIESRVRKPAHFQGTHFTSLGTVLVNAFKERREKITSLYIQKFAWYAIHV